MEMSKRRGERVQKREFVFYSIVFLRILSKSEGGRGKLFTYGIATTMAGPPEESLPHVFLARQREREAVRPNYLPDGTAEDPC